MATSSTPRTDILTDAAYALVGAADAVLERVRTATDDADDLPDGLLERLNEQIERLRTTVDEAVEALSDRASARADESAKGYETLVARGKRLFDTVRADSDVDAATADVDEARQSVQAAITALRNGASNALSLLKAAGTQVEEAAESVAEAAESASEKAGRADYSKMTKAELYEIATERDIDGRSGMNKQQLVNALRG